ncbi:MAG TPA: alkyl sulfatase dimerization domain-containing protein [Candidatus Lokiarchaeia archaeon]|nr:alkyl sulfatase dimerization domain-containing protein [Candidatus Lokiarchaeia archaeon]
MPNDKIGQFFGMFEPQTFAEGNFHFIGSFANVCVVDTDEGLVLFDIGSERFGPMIFTAVREFSEKPVKYIILSHGHFDHAFGFAPFYKEVEEKSWDPPKVIAHKNILHRFEKYRMLAEYHAWINSMQFSSILGGFGGGNSGVSAEQTLQPDILIRDDEPFTFTLGQYTFEIYPEYGETDDHLWMYVPEAKVICAGDMYLSCFPNVGNPFKVQRYPKQWAEGLDRMAEKDVEYLVPGHGVLIEGKERVQDMLTTVSEALHFVHDEVVNRLNQHMWFEEIFHEMMDIFPEKFKQSEWLQPVYGCYEYAIHATYRLYHGWYNTGNPTDLFPARSSEIAREVLELLGPGGPDKIIQRASDLLGTGNIQLALHVIDYVINGIDPSDKENLKVAMELKIKALKKRVADVPSMISKNIYTNCGKELQQRKKDLD